MKRNGVVERVGRDDVLVAVADTFQEAGSAAEEAEEAQPVAGDEGIDAPA